jgi:hypothetical protein
MPDKYNTVYKFYNKHCAAKTPAWFLAPSATKYFVVEKKQYSVFILVIL